MDDGEVATLLDGGVTVRRLPVVVGFAPESGGIISGPAGNLAQVLTGTSVNHIAVIWFDKPGIFRGHHYHARKTERIYVVEGELEAQYIDAESGELSTTNVRAGDLITVRPGIAHRYAAATTALALEIGDIPYDPSEVHAVDFTSRFD